MNTLKKMNLANQITMLRFLLVPVFVLVVSISGGWLSDLVAFLIFAIAASTDFIDGYIARSRNLVTTFGKFMDPLVDKILVTSALVALVAMDRVPAWVVILILAREFAITGLRTVAVNEGLVIAASNLGKLKTVFQMVAISLLLVYTAPFLPNDTIYIMGQICMYIALAFTMISGYDYVSKCKSLFKDI